MSSIYDVDDKKAAVGMGAMRAPGGAPATRPARQRSLPIHRLMML